MKIRSIILTLILVFIATAFVSAEDLDDQLNAAYNQALASKKLNPEYLKWIELHWIPFRDAEANLQAWIAGKNAPDENARQASLVQSTNVRLAELLHIAVDGKSADLTINYLTGGLAVAEAYASLRKEVLARRNPHLTAALILDQKAWLNFADLQAGYDGEISIPGQPNQMRANSEARLYTLRLTQLKADASELGITLTTSPPDAEDEPDIEMDRNIEVSPDHLIRIEQVIQDQKVTVWVISNATEERTMLPINNDEVNTYRSNPTVLISEFAISPDNRWIFRSQKFFHGMCGAYLYKRGSGLQYTAATRQPLDLLAWNFFKKAAQADNADVTQGGVVKFVSWGPDYLRISLNASAQLTFANVNDWLVDYDLNSKTFSIPTELKEHDRKAF